MQHCNHDFFELERLGDGLDARTGIAVMCAFCGERRWLWADGELQIAPARPA